MESSGYWRLFFYSVPVLGSALGLGIFMLFKHQHKLLYQPNVFPQWISPDDNPAGYRNPLEWGMDYDTAFVPTKDGLRLRCWFIRAKTDKAPSIIFFHGNAGNIGFRLQNLKLLHEHLNVNILVVAYRGYSGNPGEPSEEGFKLDAEAALNYLLHEMKDKVDPESIFLFGRSLGGAAAIALASARSGDIRGTIVENTFTSISDLVDTILPFIAPLKSYLLTISWKSDERVQSITHPMLFISGKLDTLIPPVHMSKLHSLAATSPNASSIVEFVQIPSGTHNDTWMKGGHHYIDAIRSFMEKALALPLTK